MKSILYLAALLTAGHCAVSMTNDFVQGFESGIFLRTAEDLQEYGCPEARPVGPFGNLKEMLAPLKAMGAFFPDKNVESILSTVDVFANSISQLLSVFSNNYEGDDFCSGLIFGSNGAQMLVNIARTVINFRQLATNS